MADIEHEEREERLLERRIAREKAEREHVAALTAENMRLRAIVTAIYEWVDRVEAAGGTTCIAGIGTAHSMIESLKKNKARVMEQMQ